MKTKKTKKTKCNQCKKHIKGKIAWINAKPHCSSCFKQIKEGIEFNYPFLDKYPFEKKNESI